jgi:HNH endonuclease/AP2 domain
MILEAKLGEPLGSRTVKHACGNRLCVNPDHLTVVDRSSMLLDNGDEPWESNQHSGRRGVYRHGRRWRAQVRHHGQAVTVGVYDTIGQAAEAARAARRKCSDA